MTHPKKHKNPMGVWWRRMMQKVKPSGVVYPWYPPKEMKILQQNANQELRDLVTAITSKSKAGRRANKVEGV